MDWSEQHSDPFAILINCYNDIIKASEKAFRFDHTFMEE